MTRVDGGTAGLCTTSQMLRGMGITRGGGRNPIEVRVSGVRSETMKTMILAAATLLSVSAGVAYAGDGEGPAANSQFTEIPGVVAQAQVPNAPVYAQGGRRRLAGPERARGRMGMVFTAPSRATALGCSRRTLTRAATANPKHSVMRRGRHCCRPFSFPLKSFSSNSAPGRLGLSLCPAPGMSECTAQ